MGTGDDHESLQSLSAPARQSLQHVRSPPCTTGTGKNRLKGGGAGAPALVTRGERPSPRRPPELCAGKPAEQHAPTGSSEQLNRGEGEGEGVGPQKLEQES